MGMVTNIVSIMLHGIPHSNTALPVMDGNQSYPILGSTTSEPALAPSMYNFNHNTGTHIPAGVQSITSNASLESRMTQLSKTILKLTQTNQVMADHQQ